MSSPVEAKSIVEYFLSVTDPRINRMRLHNLTDIIAIAILGVICGADSWTSIAEFGKHKEDWLRTFLKLPNGIPSHDTFGRLFSALDPEEFSKGFTAWVKDIAIPQEGEVIAIDGKTIRNSFDKSLGQKAIHMVSAWAHSAGIVLGQQKVEEKSNEITAIPKLLGALDINGCTVTIDAMGTQKTIAAGIIQGGADYILALKGNQGTLHADIKLLFDEMDKSLLTEKSNSFFESVDGDHGRIETRSYWTWSDLEGIETSNWKGLSAIGITDRTRQIGEQCSYERSYFLISRDMSAEEFGKSVRAHWAVENNLHWALDVSFNEDKSRVRKDHAPENFNTLRKISLALLKNTIPERKVGIAIRRLKAGWDNNFLAQVLRAGLS